MSASCCIGHAVDGRVNHCQEHRLPAEGTALAHTDTINKPEVRCRILSISRPAREILLNPIHRYRELGHFRRSLNLIAISETPAYEGAPPVAPALVTLVTPDVGNGPFHVVVATLPPALGRPAPALWRAHGLRIGPWQLATPPSTPVWEPAPRWEAMTLAGGQLARLRRGLAGRLATGEPALPALSQAAGAMFRALKRGEPAAIGGAAARLAGLGTGLTPAGDDILAGVLLALFADHHPDAARLAASIHTAAAPRTTTLSRAFLAAASRGETTESWHRLLAALCGKAPADLIPAMDRVLDFGATSGLSMLQGFVGALTPSRDAMRKRANA